MHPSLARYLFSALVLGLLCAPAEAQTSANPAQLMLSDGTLSGQGLAADDPRLAWKLFLSVNQPVIDGQPGVADPTPRTTAAGLAVWETWKSTRQVFLANGAPPSPWGSSEHLLYDPRTDGLRLTDGTLLFSALDKGDITSGLKDIDGRPIYSEIRMNKIAFDHVLAEGLYNVEGQLAYYQRGQDLDMPVGSMEVKVSWRVLEPEASPALRASYFQTSGVLDRNGTFENVTLGMTSMNILWKSAEGWFATAFEHAGNPEQTANVNFPEILLDLRRPANYRAFNQQVQADLSGTVWANYRANGGQFHFADEAGNPIFLTNTQQETDIMKTSSCLGCHGYSGIAIIDGQPTRLSPLLATYSDILATGYVGALDQAALAKLATMDFMWSMTEASAMDPKLKVRFITLAELLRSD